MGAMGRELGGNDRGERQREEEGVMRTTVRQQSGQPSDLAMCAIAPILATLCQRHCTAARTKRARKSCLISVGGVPIRASFHMPYLPVLFRQPRPGAPGSGPCARSGIRDLLTRPHFPTTSCDCHEPHELAAEPMHYTREAECSISTL